METQPVLEDLIKKARSGDENAEQEFFNKLSVRFSVLIARELRKYQVFAERLNLEESCCEICQFAIAEVKKLCSLNNPNFSMLQAVNILHHAMDTFVTNRLVELAKQGVSEAEELLFSIIRKKLLERVTNKKWREVKNECEDR